MTTKPIEHTTEKLTMNYYKLIPAFLLLLTGIGAKAQKAQSTPVEVKAANGMTVRVTYLSDDIVRVTKWTGKQPKDGSLAVTMQPHQVKTKVTERDNDVTLLSKQLQVTVDRQSGCVSFATAKAKILLTEGKSSIEPIREGADRGCYRVSQSFAIGKDEPIYGVGLMENGKLDQHGEDRLMIQSNLEDYQNVVQSLRGYGLFWDNYSPTQFQSKTDLTFASQVGDAIDYYFMYGRTADGVVALIRQLTGDAPMLPIQSYGFWQSRERYKSSRELTDVVDTYRKLQVPLDGIVLDWQYWDSNYLWNAMEFLNPEFKNAQQMIDHVHKQNAKFAISIWQSFGPHTKGYRDMEQKGLLFDYETWPQSGLSAWPPNMDYPSGVRVYKPYTEEARDIYWKHLQHLYNMGVDAWWMDSTDPDHHSFKEADLDEPTELGSYRKVRNAFPLMCVKGVYEHQRAANTSADARRAFIYTRSGFAGQQRYACNVWTGDVGSNWQNLRNQIPMGLSFSLTGNPNFNSDIGGFFSGSYNARYGDATSGCRNPQFQELYVRWMQFGAFCPMMRSHGTETYREVYYFGKQGEPVYDALTEAIRLRYRLLPYIYSTSWDVTHRRGTFMRALMMDFAHDPKAVGLTNEYMFGRELLVAPVVKAQYTQEKIVKTDPMTGWDAKKDNGEPMATGINFLAEKSTSVYLPQGTRWYNFFTGKAYDGGQAITLPTTLKTIPLFVRAGSIVPIGPDVQYTTEKPWDELELRVYPGADGTFTLYEDEGNNYRYEQGAYTEIELKWNDRQRTLTIGQRRGQFSGMLQSRTFTVVTPDGQSRKVSYQGKKVSVKL